MSAGFHGLSVVVIVYNMRREAPRTLRSLSADYQRGIAADDYEVLVVENGSTEPLDPEVVAGYGANFRYLPVPDPQPSPAGAVNFGLRQARGALLAVMIDGARLASPGLLARAMSAARLHPRAVVATTSWHLGPESQQYSVAGGYSQQREDDLLNAIEWPQGDGYRLFEIGVPARSAREGIFRVPGESNFLCLPRALLVDELGGCDERFNLPGGGLVNQDLFRRACDLPDSELVLLLGEATFHQLHGGISTNPGKKTPEGLGKQWHRQYQELRGKPFTRSTRAPLLYGSIPPTLAPTSEWSARLGAALETTMDPTLRAELIQTTADQDLVARTEMQRWLLLDQWLPLHPSPVEQDAPEASLPIACPPPSLLARLNPWTPRRKPAAVPRKKILLFCVNYRKLQGAHLKTWHYFQHARQSEQWEPRIYLSPTTIWDADNPWHDERANALTEYRPEEADALFIDGQHNWLRLPAATRRNWPVPVVCSIQGFRNLNPTKSHKEFLGCRAVRICVSEQVCAAIESTGRVRGPTFVIPNAIDLPPEVQSPVGEVNDLFIAGMKNSGLAGEIEAVLRAAGWRVTTVTAQIPRGDFLATLRGSAAVLFLPRPREGFYLPALEAMALGTPVVCPDVLGNRTFCRDGVNCLRPPYTKDALLAACFQLREQSPADRKQMRSRARETASRHTLENERKQFLRVLENLSTLWQTEPR